MYSKALELSPEYALVYSNRGDAYIELGEYQKAIDDCTEAIKLDPVFAFAYYNRGIAYTLL